MAAFPTIYRHTGLVQQPQVDPMNNQMASDPVISSPIEGGYRTTRARFTRIVRKWAIRYEWMTVTNKNTIKTFEEARVAGAESFTWTNPSDSTSYTVRFVGPIIYTPHKDTNWLYWILEFELEQV